RDGDLFERIVFRRSSGVAQPRDERERAPRNIRTRTQCSRGADARSDETTQLSHSNSPLVEFTRAQLALDVSLLVLQRFHAIQPSAAHAIRGTVRLVRRCVSFMYPPRRCGAQQDTTMLRAVVVATLCSLLCASAFAEDTPKRWGVLERYCFDCHNTQ